MILYFASFFVCIYISFSLFWSAPWPRSVKLALFLLVLIASLKYEFYQLFGGAFFAPQLPRWLLIAYEALYGALIVLFFMLLFKDLLRFTIFLLHHFGLLQGLFLPIKQLRIILPILALCLGCWGTWEAVKVPAVHEKALEIPALPKALNGLRIVHLSDLHIGPLLGRRWLEKVVEKVNGLAPDLILLTGDYIDGPVSRLAGEIAPLGKLESKYGVFGVTGNHEYYWNAREWISALTDLRVNMLENSHRLLNIRGKQLVIAGLPDLAAKKFSFPGPNLEDALKNAPNFPRILLSHQPRNALQNLAHTQIQLSGHTHGGLMFFLRPLIAAFNGGFVSGLYNFPEKNGKSLHINPGTGLWNGFSCRIGADSEISLLILKAAREKQ